MPPTPPGCEAFGRNERRQEGQRPDPPGPRDGRQQHQAHPAQPARLDEVRVRRAHGVAVDAPGPDAPPPAPLDGVVDGHHDRGPRGTKVSTRSLEQDARAGPRTPRRAAEHAVVVHEVALPRKAHDPQHARHRAPARRQQRADQEHLGVAPGAVDEERREGQDDPGEAGGQLRHGASLGGDAATLPAVPASSPALAHPLTDPRRLNGQSRAEGTSPPRAAKRNRRGRVLGCACGPHHPHRFRSGIATPHASPAGQADGRRAHPPFPTRGATPMPRSSVQPTHILEDD